jgi:DNA polymerase-3 subunit gamma/tau
MAEFLVTARKWRPLQFDEVVGQSHITTTLKNAIKNGRIAHAYMFTGPRGVGKTTTARILAKAVNCLNPVDFEPCGKCEVCQDIQNNRLMDIIEIDGASNRGIDEIKNLRETVKYAPSKAKYKVYIIDEVHMLTRESFNAFLKTLEEPPSHAIFIFATTDIHKVPLTIISRCQRYDFRRIELNTIKAQLTKIAQNEDIKIDDTTLTLIAKKADGALRDAESFFDQVVAFCGTNVEHSTVAKMLNLIDDEIYFTISDAILSKSYNSVFEVSRKLYDNGWNFMDFLDGLIDHFRNILTVAITNSNTFIEAADIYKSKYEEYYGNFSEGDLIRILNFLNKSSQEIKYSQNQKIKIEITLTQLIGLEKSSTISQVIEEIKGLKDNHIYQPAAAPKIDLTSQFSVKEPAPVKKSIIDTSAANKKYGSAPGSSPFDMWKNFVTTFDKDRFSMLGSLVKNLKFVEYDKDKLKLELTDPEMEGTYSSYNGDLISKLSSHFGHKVSVTLTKDKQPAKPVEKPQKSVKESLPVDDFQKYIINNLGGKKIN